MYLYINVANFIVHSQKDNRHCLLLFLFYICLQFVKRIILTNKTEFLFITVGYLSSGMELILSEFRMLKSLSVQGLPTTFVHLTDTPSSFCLLFCVTCWYSSITCLPLHVACLSFCVTCLLLCVVHLPFSYTTLTDFFLLLYFCRPPCSPILSVLSFFCVYLLFSCIILCFLTSMILIFFYVIIFT